LPAQFVPPAQQALLTACGSGATAGFCTPDTIIEAAGNVQPPSCVAFSGVPQSEGRCLSPCLAAVSSQPSLETSSCGSNKCAPCYNPITGAATGACSSSKCDSPQQPPYVFPNCCNGNEGRCVPKSQVPSNLQGNLNQNSCNSSNYLCVPNENLPGGTGWACSAWSLFEGGGYNGTCISNCVNLGLGVLLPQGNCPADHTCVPCGSAPKGSTGCP
jgi:hypothetical protein